MRQQRALNGFGGHFASGDIDLVPQTSAQEDLAVPQFRQVAGVEGAGGEAGEIVAATCRGRAVLTPGRPVGFAHGGATDGQTTGGIERHGDILHGAAGQGRIKTRDGRGIVGNAAAFGGAEEVMDFEAAGLEDFLFDI